MRIQPGHHLFRGWFGALLLQEHLLTEVTGPTLSCLNRSGTFHLLQSQLLAHTGGKTAAVKQAHVNAASRILQKKKDK